jgi:hypothetical protein
MCCAEKVSNLIFRTTHTVKTQQVIKSRGHHCGDIELGIPSECGGSGVCTVGSPYRPLTVTGVVLILVLTDIYITY